MTDVEYLFKQDCKEKKNIGRGYFAKNRTGKGRVKFPSDYLTKKEKNKMNGEVISWDLNKIYSWEEFKALPNDLKLPYLQKLVDTYGVTLTDISKYQFRKGGSTLLMHLKSVDLSSKNLHTYGPGYRMTYEDRSRYQQAINDALGAIEEKIEKKPAKHAAKEEKIEEKPAEIEAPVWTPWKPSKKHPSTLNRISFEMDGWNYMLLDMISKSFGNKNVRVSITVEEV